MIAILKREYRRYFSTPVGYIFMVAFLAISGFAFLIMNLLQQSAELGNMFSFLMFVVLLLVPIHTMHLMAEEKKNKTDQLLLTAPVSIPSIIVGKYLASVLVVVVTLLIAFIYAIITIVFGKPSIPSILGNYFGFLLLAASYISIGLWVSCLTENQVVSAVVSYVVLMLTWMLGSVANSIPNPFFAQLTSYITPLTHFNNFSMGLLNFTDLVYFISVIVLFLFLSVRALEKRRWS